MLGRLWVLASLPLAMTLIVAAAADAVPIRDVQVRPGKPLIRFEFTVRSPAAAKTCFAPTSVSLWALDSRPKVRVRKVTRALNVCQNGTRGDTFGEVEGQFASATLARGRYELCIAASQVLRDGVVDLDRTCRRFRL